MIRSLILLRQPDAHRHDEQFDESQFVASITKPIGASRLFDTMVNALSSIPPPETASKPIVGSAKLRGRARRLLHSFRLTASDHGCWLLKTTQ